MEAAAGTLARSGASKDDIFAMLVRIMVGRFDFAAEEIVPEAHIVEDLDLDSIDTLDLAVQVEEETGLELDEEELKGVERLADVVDVIHTRLGSASA
jgi:acyl carrier protein